ncbi:MULTISPECIES: hypothetical protein [Cysteiniphilum]|uniref:Uncharacterized protein n=1 Tax=Cysteiniphilum litorale TaxID=2056700 RepID=A0A8J2Z324_9GAMM|nr:MULTISPECIES: hypothetical protein [Cysteiniphilum]GGF91636.1 hypothetical protein GCM10010995_06070 [Cysteiniphilum litorale]
MFNDFKFGDINKLYAKKYLRLNLDKNLLLELERIIQLDELSDYYRTPGTSRSEDRDNFKYQNSNNEYCLEYIYDVGCLRDELNKLFIPSLFNSMAFHEILKINEKSVTYIKDPSSYRCVLLKMKKGYTAYPHYDSRYDTPSIQFGFYYVKSKEINSEGNLILHRKSINTVGDIVYDKIDEFEINSGSSVLLIDYTPDILHSTTELLSQNIERYLLQIQVL